MITIDINCDLGEGIGNEALIMPLISSCNIACGGHAGDLATMEYIVALAEKHDVKIGAHPSFPDQVNFGRKVMDMSSDELRLSLVEQINTLKQVLKNRGLKLHHVKPHGALYNLAAIDKDTAKVVVDVVKAYNDSLVLYAPYGSIVSEIAFKSGVRLMFEAFADRNYNQDLTLVSREQNNALIHEPDVMLKHVCQMVLNKKVTTLDGVEVALKADTFCVHGDGENVVQNLKDLVVKLKQNQIEIS